MFKKNATSSDVKKSLSKCLDVKRDTPTRLRHLRTVLDNTDVGELRAFLDANFSPVFHIFYEAFITFEGNLKQKGTFAVQKGHKEDLECSLFVLDRLLCLLPERFEKRWQCNALTHIFKKILHPGNIVRLRRDAMRLFIIWYMIVGDNKTPEMDRMFASIVPGFPTPPPASISPDLGCGGITCLEPSPVIPPSSTEKTPPDDLSSYFLRSLLDYMVTQVRRVEWQERTQQPRAFSYLFNMFRMWYMPHIFPNFNSANSLYKPNLELPELRSSPGVSPYGTCQVAVVEWVRKFVVTASQRSGQSAPLVGEEDGRRSGHSDAPEGSTSDQDSITSAFYVTDEMGSGEDAVMVREILFSSRDNINFIHELFRQALCLSFRYAAVMKTVIFTYKDWIQMNAPEMPPFMLEPLEGGAVARDEGVVQQEVVPPQRRIRNESYLGAINKDIHIRAGLQNVLQVFVTSVANVFLLEVSPDYPRLLDEQVDVCKHVLNIYRYMVMNTRMEQKTWEQLLVVLLHVTSQTLCGRPTTHKEDSLGSRFASALFQTLIVSWIKANLNVCISGELWDQLLLTLSSLTHWDELIKEWAKTLDTLTRVLARHVYGLELNSLPLERVNERRLIKRGATKLSGLDSVRSSFARSWTSVRMERQANTPEAHTPGGPPTLTNLQEESHPDNASSQGSNDRSPFARKRRGSAGGGSLKASGGGNGSSPKLSPHHPSEERPHTSHQHHHHSHHHPSHHHHSLGKRLSRSLSESNLPVRRQSRRGHMRDDCDNHRFLHGPRSKSLETLSHGYGDDDSRTPSPSPSSGVESSSMKDSPMQIELGGDTTSIDTLEGGLSSEQRSVMSGGTVRGWLPDVAVVLWRRVLGLLGDPNDVASPQIHAQIFKYLSELTETLVKLRNNQSISLDNQSSPEPPELIPPLTLVAPWCFRALTLPPAYRRGKTTAYRLLCVMMVRHHDIPLPRDMLTHFYRVLHQGLVGQDQEVINTLVAECGPSFFSLGLPGSSMLTLDFIFATNTVITSTDAKIQSPKMEALSLLGSLLPLSSLYPSMPVLQPSASDLTLMNCSDVKDHLVNVLLKSGKRDGWWRTRSLALSTLAIYLYHELAHQTFHTKVNEAINVLLASLKIGRLVSQVAADLLLLLCDHSEAFLTHYPDIPGRIIQVLCQTLGAIGTDQNLTGSSEGKHLVLSCLFCLAEWVMRMPHQVLIQPGQDRKPLLQHVFKVLHVITSGKKNGHFRSPNIEVLDFDAQVKEEASRNNDSGPRTDSLKRSTFTQPCTSTIQLAAKSITSHIMNHLWHFPLGVGAQRLSSLVVEGDDVPGLTSDELSSEVFLSPHVQLFALNQSCLLSLVQLPALQVPGGAATVGFKTPSSEVRLILRDLSGKFSWDASLLYAPPDECVQEQPGVKHPPHPPHSPHQSTQVQVQQQQQPIIASVTTNFQTGAIPSPTGLGVPFNLPPGLDSGRDDTMSSSLVVTSPPRHTLRHRPPGVLPTHEDSAEDMDNLDDLLSYIGHTSPEVLEQFGHALNEAVGPPPTLPIEAQHDGISSILNQRNVETDFFTRHSIDLNMVCPSSHCPHPVESRSAFQQGRLLFDQLGLGSWEKRQSIYTLKKNDKLLRELKNLDNQKCRETHKMAVIYVAEGQEDKMSILSNSGGSAGFEEFVGGLGWEVELSSHTGFLGGLQRNGSTGETAPYYATSLTEVVFHVSTRMPSFSEQSMLQKTRHLGNDEVHIVWSEHTRDYRRGIIPTEFCDVLIVIYPLPNRLYRIQISTKPEVPFFGPLFDGAIVAHKVLPGLVRSTAVNASRAKRSRLALYQNFYEERARALNTIIEQYSEATTFEAFISSVYCPVFPSTFASGPTRASGTSFSSRVFDGNAGTTGLAAALLDGPQLPPGPPQRPPLTRPTSYSTGEQHHLREKARRVRQMLGGKRHHSTGSKGPPLTPPLEKSNNNISHEECDSCQALDKCVLLMDHMNSNEDTGSSPRGNKKLSFKNPRKASSAVASTGVAAAATTPPESPMPPPRRPKDGTQHAAQRNK
ncbi:ral GTPase-activating protein subunit alpha-2-like isoform X3 [Eriocheir sinensis]|uniref:ral GTPase-activating protein subunit alpha-2-like isoform X3 n=1 Tax=Eriocheir sinensis TaxID=95602 RepID=UPI0021C89D03|nr:ral GTPase-activating protein subunit alpha-2-like isoform X3 [Eriocheir sinensis]